MELGNEYLEVTYDGQVYFGREKQWFLVIDEKLVSAVINDPKIRAIESLYYSQLTRIAYSKYLLTKNGGTKQ